MMNDQEKSVLLIQAVGWEVLGGISDDQRPVFTVLGHGLWYSYELSGYATTPPTFEADFNLYTLPMDLTWKMANWANANAAEQRKEKTGSNWITCIHDLHDMISFGDDLVNVKRAWLDRIFSSVVEAGLIKTGEDKG